MSAGVDQVMGILEGCGAGDLDLAEFIVDLATKCANEISLGQQLEQFGADFPGAVVHQLWLATHAQKLPTGTGNTANVHVDHPPVPASSSTAKRKRVDDADTHSSAVAGPAAEVNDQATVLPPSSKRLRDDMEASPFVAATPPAAASSSQSSEKPEADSILRDFLDELDDDEAVPAQPSTSNGKQAKATTTKPAPETAIPAGFFDDPLRDAKVRKVEFVDKEEEERKQAEADREEAEADQTERLDKQFSLMTTERILQEEQEQRQLLDRVRVMKEKGVKAFSAVAAGGAAMDTGMVQTEAREGSDSGDDSEEDSDDDGWGWRRKGI